MALYTSWLLSISMEENVDFNVDSYTLLFSLLKPIYYLLGNEFEVIYAFRFIFSIVITIISYQSYILMRFFIPKSSAISALFLLLTSLALVVRGLDIRPDLIITSLWLQIIIVIYVYSFNGIYKMIIIGFTISLAILFKFKAIVICPIIVYYWVFRLVVNKSIKKSFSEIIAFIFGFLGCFLLFIAVEGGGGFKLFIDTTIDLILYSTSNSSTANLLKFEVLKSYMVLDIMFWLPAIAGIGSSIIMIKSQELSFNQAQCLVSILILALLSIVTNPHYHAYNLVTLYSLLTPFVAFTIHKISKVNGIMSSFIVFISCLFLLYRGFYYTFKNNNQHQIALHQFINKNTEENDAVFAFEGIGLYRPSTYHWRTSAIKLSNYYEGNYSVWYEINKTAPILVIESYRIPKWLTKKDRSQLYNHYIELAPFVLVMGFETESIKQAEVLREGWYLITNSELNACLVNEENIVSGDKVWLKSGLNTMVAKKGHCKLHWFFSSEAISLLKESNLNHRPYLYAP
ncbi:hypothetical protein [Vibrio sp. 10N.286.49.B3]|uniref:hypothetical protein n=1 Tax=Vibrio sp. 10N.286.49.B3 TaxID=1880855 RepID=UPI000C863F91|nr:hypothetical protein [Vibrio sp. 10N.286.49.B3]